MKKLFAGFGIVKKMVIGYFVIVFVPVIAFGLYYYNQLYESMIEEFASGKQQVIEQAYSNLKMDLLQLESHYGLFQYNSSVVEYLNGAYQSESAYVYHFLKDVRPILSYAVNGNSNIGSIKIYARNERVFAVPEQIMHENDLPSHIQNEVGKLLPGEGKWYYDLTESSEWSLIYYQNIYAERFSKQIGVFEIRVDPTLMDNFVNTLSNEGRSEVHLFSGNSVSDLPDGAEKLADKIREESSSYFFLDNKRQIINQLTIDKLGIRIAVVSQAEDVFVQKTRKKILLIIVVAGLLLLLSGMYYLLASSVTKRLLRLARHMRTVGEDNFRLIHQTQDQDEIGYLTSTYNLMLQRMDELVNRIQRSELLRKEAAYKVLQAQVKPHFLYNTLETIRMLAETNDDHEVAEIAYSFGQLMRYSLSNHHDQVRLSDEVKYIDHFMKIHKMRLGNRVVCNFEIKTNVKRIPCPPFILQPLVENCIVHGLPTTREEFRIRIKIHEDDRYVYIEISDNGVGIPEERLNMLNKVLNHLIDVKHFSSHEGGHGLYNVSERIKAFYGEDSRMEIESREDAGTTLNLYLNKKGMFKHVESVGSR